MTLCRHGILIRCSILVMVLGMLQVSVSMAQQGPFMMVFLNHDPNRPVLPQAAVDSLQAAHMENIRHLAGEGKLLIAGPFDGGGGIFVLATGSKDTANMWLSTDPAVRSKRWIVEIYPYVPQIGGVCVVGADYKMATYGFIRFTYDKGNVENRLMELVDRRKIVAAGSLEGSGMVVVVRGDVDEAAIRKEPLVQDGTVRASVLKLWIAKGSFCED